MKKNILLSLLSVFVIGLQAPGHAQAQNDSRSKAKKKVAKTAAAPQRSKRKETVNDLIQEAAARRSGRGKNIQIQKQNAALPQAMVAAPKNPVPLGQVKPPRSNELFREAGSDEEKLEQVTEQGIQELYKLTQQYSKSPNRGELWLRLAELYVEKAKFIEYRLQKDYDDKLALYLAKKGPKPVLNLNQSKEYNSKAIKLYEFYLRDFPKSPKVDQALFFLGYNNVELDRVQVGINYYKQLTKDYPNSPYVSEAYFALGEYYFDNDKWADALKAYSDVLRNRRARLYTFALYKIAWCQYRLGHAGQGLKTLEQVIALSRRPEGAGDLGGRKPVSKIRLGSEALKDVVLFYVDVGDAKAAKDYFYRLGGEKAQWIMLEKLAYLYGDNGRKDEAYYVFKQLLEYNPTAPKAFDYQYQIVQLFSTIKNQAVYKTELYTWIDNFGPDSAWAQANAQNKKLLEDAYTLRESALRNYVLLLHKNAQNSQKKSDLANTKQAYELYLAKFPDAPRSPEMHFFYGELLYSLNEFPAAAEQYKLAADKDPKGKYFEQSVLNTVLALEKGLKNDDQIKELVGESLDPVPFGEAEANFTNAAERYIKALPKGEKIVEVKFKVARLHYAYNHFDDAIRGFKLIVNDHPKSQYAVYAANLILDIYNLRKDYDGLAREGLAFMNNRALTEGGFQTDVRDLVEKASFKKAQDLEVQKNFLGSAQAFADFNKKYPASKLAVPSAFNAGVNFERAHHIPEAIVFYGKVASHAGKQDEGLRTKALLLLAHLYEQTAQFQKAAVQYEKFAKENPKDKQTPDLWYNSAVIREGEKQYSLAIEDYQRYFDSTRRKDRNQAIFAIAKIHEKMGHIKATKESFQHYLDVGGGEPEKVVEAHFKMADLEDKQGHKSEAEKGYRRTIYSAKHYEDSGKPAGQVWAAEAKFRLTQQTFKDMLAVRIPANPKKQAAALKEKIGLVTKLSRQLADVIKYNEGNMVIASLTTLGQANEHLVKTIRSAPVPKDLNKNELEQYNKQLESIYKPFEDQAIQNYTAAIKKSYELNFYNKWTKQALDAMAKYQPDQYAEPSEVVIPVARTDDMGT